MVACDVPREEGGNSAGTDGFKLAQEILGTSIEYRYGNIENLELAGEGFDVVFCFGVLYHVKDILRSCETLARVTKGYALIETAYLPVWDGKFMEYRPRHHGDPTNYWYPSFPCLESMLQESGFATVEIVHVLSSDRRSARFTVRASK